MGIYDRRIYDDRIYDTITTRHPFHRPFSSNSAFNISVGDGAQYVPIDSPVLKPGSAVNINVTRYSKNAFLAGPDDPVKPLYRSNTPVPGQVMLEYMVPVPASFAPNGGTDGHAMIAVIDEFGAWVYESGAVRPYGGGWRGEWWHPNDLRGTGILPRFGGSGAWGNCALGGLVRAGEPEQGIRHVLACTINPLAINGGFDGEQWPSDRPPKGPGHTWPANSQDHGYGTSGNVYLGSRFAIPWSVDVEGLGITDLRALNFARCLREYGCWPTGVGDVYSGIVFNGNGAEEAALRFPPRAAMDDLRDPFWRGLALATSHLQIITNTSPETPGGGGNDRVPRLQEVA